MNNEEVIELCEAQLPDLQSVIDALKSSHADDSHVDSKLSRAFYSLIRARDQLVETVDLAIGLIQAEENDA
jgi:hypothetical protein